MSNLLDKLTEEGSPDHVVILHYGDPAYRIRSSGEGLSLAESIFLRLVAYLIFAETVAVPTRYILESDAVSQAIVWAAPLMEEGILVPERRAEVSSFENLVAVRGLPEISRERATWLDAHAKRIRTFRYRELSHEYRHLLTEDLSLEGAFRRTVDGGIKGRLRDALLRAHEDPAIASIVTPEDFVQVVKRYAPSQEAAARRWAMARYYTTPLRFDQTNTREIPTSAASLLIKGGLLDASLRPFSGAAPAEEIYNRLAANIPLYGVTVNHRIYCEAVLEVRRALPEARKIFSDIREAAQLADAGRSLSDMLARELARQQNVLARSGRMYTIVTSLLGGVAAAGLGLLAGGDVALAGEIGVGVSVVGGVAFMRLKNAWINAKNKSVGHGFLPWIEFRLQ